MNISNDSDCDGIITEEDCDDDNPLAQYTDSDTDCDGVVTEEDCDDDNPLAQYTDNDADCDGSLRKKMTMEIHWHNIQIMMQT